MDKEMRSVLNELCDMEYVTKPWDFNALIG